MRILIVGGGVAGLTLAAKLRQQGLSPVLVEKSEYYGDTGYGLGLYPLGSCVLHGIGAYDAFLASGQPTTRYEVCDGKGNVLQSADMSTFTDDMGPVVMVPRTDLIPILCDAATGTDLRMGTRVADLTQQGDADSQTVKVEFTDGTSQEFDLVVAADGIYSEVRTSVFGHQKPYDTDWVFFTWWARVPDWDKDLVREHWGPGTFFGLYPCPERVMCGAGMPVEDAAILASDIAGMKAFLRTRNATLIESDPRVEQAIDSADAFFTWPMTDVKSASWIKGRVALCGDAATGFLPTAGVGASNAMRGAAALADELSRANADSIPLALELYEKRARKIIEDNQQDSRTAAKYMFVDSKAAAWGRDRLVSVYPANRVISQIVASMKSPF
jgi:2-polyprenyl-6-methoxyphenol hydroxylase-like FAD-dependent oxidoreductase